MLTLTQFVTLDSVSDIYGPLVLEQPWLLLYFFAILLIIPISLMNLVTAVLVDAAMALSKSDNEDQLEYRRRMLKQLRPEISNAFREIDVDGSGVLTPARYKLQRRNYPKLSQISSSPTKCSSSSRRWMSTVPERSRKTNSLMESCISRCRISLLRHSR